MNMEAHEKKFEDALVKELERRMVFCHHFDAIGCDGWPDLLLLKNNRCLLVECKYNTLALRKDQEAFRVLLHSRYGFDQHVVAVKRPNGYVIVLDGGNDMIPCASMAQLVELLIGLMGINWGAH